MPQTALPFANGFYESDSLPLSAQDCVNWFPHIPDEPALSPAVLFQTPGIYQVATSGTSGTQINRGAKAIGETGRPYFVQGQNLYRLNADNTLVSLGTIAGSGRVSIADNGTQMMLLVPGGKGYIFTENPDTLVEITDSDFLANGKPQHVEFVDGYFVCTTDEKKFIISALNDGKAWNSLDFGSAESSPDGVVTPFVYRNQLFIGGERSTEAFSNVGGADFPFQRTGLFLDEGIRAPFSVVSAKNAVMFVGAGKNEGPGVYELRDNATQKISTKAIDRLLQALNEEELATVFAWFYSQRGHFFTGFVLPDTTIVYDSSTGKWHERQSRIQNGGIYTTVPWRVNSLVTVAGLTYAGDSQDGRIGIVDLDTYDEYTADVVRAAATMPFQNTMRPFFVTQLEMTVESGVGKRLAYGTVKQYDSGSYLEKLVEVVEKGTNGSVVVLDEDSATDHPEDQTSFNNDFSDVGTPTVGQVSFIDDNRNSTTIDGTNGYRNTSPGLTSTGMFGFCYDHDDVNDVAIMDLDFGNSSMRADYTGTTEFLVNFARGGSSTAVTFTGLSLGSAEVYYIYYSVSGTSYTVSLYVDFELQETKTGSLSFTWDTGGSDEVRIGSTAGGGDGKAQYVFYGDHVFTTTDIAELEDAYNQNQIGYVDPNPSVPTPENEIDPVIRLQVSRNGGKTYSDERPRKIGKIGEYGKRAIWRRVGRTDRFDVYRIVFSDATKCALLQLTGNIEGEDVAAA